MSKAIADKADIGVITCKVTEEDLNNLTRTAGVTFNIPPNQVTDVYKVRRGRWVDVRIWSRMDLGTCRKEDVFITDGNYHTIGDFNVIFHSNILYSTDELVNQIVEKINKEETIIEEVATIEEKPKKADWADLI